MTEIRTEAIEPDAIEDPFPPAVAALAGAE